MKKEYTCKKCGAKFHRGLFAGFIKTVLPQCPSCGSSNVVADNLLTKEEKKNIFDK